MQGQGILSSQVFAGVRACQLTLCVLQGALDLDCWCWDGPRKAAELGAPHLEQLLVLIGREPDLKGLGAGAGVPDKGPRGPGLLTQQQHSHIGPCSAFVSMCDWTQTGCKASTACPQLHVPSSESVVVLLLLLLLLRRCQLAHAHVPLSRQARKGIQTGAGHTGA